MGMAKQPDVSGPFASVGLRSRTHQRRLQRDRLPRHLVSEVGQAFAGAAFDRLGIPPIKIVDTEGRIRLLTLQHDPDALTNGMRHREGGPFGTPSGCQPTILGPQVGGFSAPGPACRLPQRTTQSAIARGGAAR